MVHEGGNDRIKRRFRFRASPFPIKYFLNTVNKDWHLRFDYGNISSMVYCFQRAGLCRPGGFGGIKARGVDGKFCYTATVSIPFFFSNAVNTPLPGFRTPEKVPS